MPNTGKRDRNRAVSWLPRRATGARRLPIALLIPSACLLAGSSRAQTAIEWESIEPIDEGNVEVSTASSRSVLRIDGEWVVVYCRDGQVLLQTRYQDGWAPVELVSTVPGSARDPHLDWTGNILWVAWEDDRTGAPEVWVRSRSGSTWSGETCLTLDGIPSRAPAISAFGDHVLVVWEEGEATREIRGRAHQVDWGPPMTISGSAGSAFEPAVGTTTGAEGIRHVVAWADTRDGSAQIRLRTEGYSGWLPEQAVTNFDGECRRPAFATAICCGDVPGDWGILVFDHTPAPGSASEIWSACGIYWDGDWDLSLHPVTEPDGVRSTEPAVAAYSFGDSWVFPGANPREFILWTDGATDDLYRISHGASCPSEFDVREEVSSAGLSRAAVGCADWGNPEVPLLVLWIEEIDGAPTLLARCGTVPGCTGPDPHAPRAMLVSPGGIPADTLVMLDDCSHDPVADKILELHFSPDLDQALTWDPAQEHPDVAALTDSSGRAVFTVRGGGCSEEGTVTASYEWHEFATWQGAKSPDVNGDCIVEIRDVEAIRRALGGDSFCADLDWDGDVDEDDLSIVTAALGTHCSNITAAPPPSPDPAARLILEPNPCRGQVTLRLGDGGPPGRIRIFDLSGRVIRVLDQAERPGGAGGLIWDTRDERGRVVPSGLYWVSAAGDGARARSLLVLR